MNFGGESSKVRSTCSILRFALEADAHTRQLSKIADVNFRSELRYTKVSSNQLIDAQETSIRYASLTRTTSSNFLHEPSLFTAISQSSTRSLPSLNFSFHQARMKLLREFSIIQLTRDDMDHLTNLNTNDLTTVFT